MKKSFALIVFLFAVQCLIAQLTSWQSFTDSIPTLSSPRACDLNNDGIKDIVIGGGTDGVTSNNGVMAFNGVNGSLLWKRGSRNEVFGSPIFQDITSDGIKDVFISGRQAQLLAIHHILGYVKFDLMHTNHLNCFTPRGMQRCSSRFAVSWPTSSTFRWERIQPFG